jgi:hypothetical protein
MGGDLSGTASNAQIVANAVTDTELNSAKLNAIEASADVTDTTNVTAAGALMDSEVTNLAQVKAFDTTDYATAAQGTTADAALPKAGGTLTGDLSLGDAVKATFGASDDLQIYHDGSNSRISDVGTGNLIIRGSAGTYIQSVNGENGVVVLENGAALLYHNGAEKLATTAAGINVTGNVIVSGTVDGRDVATDGSKLDGIATGATANGTVTGSGTTSGTNTGDQTSVSGSSGSCTGNAATATALAYGVGTVHEVGRYLDMHGGTGAPTDFDVRLDAGPGTGTGGAGTLNIAASGGLVCSGDVTAFSDARIKDNVEVIPDALSKVKQLNGYTFTRNDSEDTTKRYTGVIAQEVLTVLPEAVVLGETSEDTMSVAYGNMMGLMIEAIKELEAKVEALENK